MKAAFHVLFQSLVVRVFALYAASMLLFIGSGLGLFYSYQFSQSVNDAEESISIMAEVLAPTISDSVVIGDYDTVKRILSKASLRAKLSSAAFIDVSGGIILAEPAERGSTQAPAWLFNRIALQLFDANQIIAVGGRDYGVLRLRLSAHAIAEEIWRITQLAAIAAGISLVFGITLIWLPLRRWLGNIDRMRAFESGLDMGATHTTKLEVNDVPLEIRRTFEVLNRAASSLQIQRERAAVTLNAIADGVITTDNSGVIVFANPVAIRIFTQPETMLLGANIRTIFPYQFDEHSQHQAITPWDGQRIEWEWPGHATVIMDTDLSVIASADGTLAGYVLVCRDITESHRLETQLRVELKVREAALESLSLALKGLQTDSELPDFDVSGHDLAAVAELIALLVRDKAQTRRALDNQKFALDQHAIVSITNANGDISYANEKFFEISGYQASELIGQNHRLIKSGMHSASFYLDIWQTISNGKVWHGQIANRRKNGEIYWVASTIVPWMDEHGLPYQYVSIRTDITVQKNVEFALAEARRRELETGHHIQRTLLFGDVPAGIEQALIATYTEPSQGIDGDFYAITRFSPDCFEILVGDVMGKGVPAALIGAAVKTTYNQVLAELMHANMLHKQLPPPADIINLLHRYLTPRLIELASFATLVLYRFELDKRQLTLVNAGHTPGLIWHGAQGQIETILGDNMPIGVCANEIYLQSSIAFGPGDTLLAYSDGITEARNQQAQEFGLNGLIQLAQTGRQQQLPPQVFLQSLRHQLRQFSQSELLADDQTALMVELCQAPEVSIDVAQPVDRRLLILPWKLTALSELRHAISAIAQHCPEELVAALILASFEAATNAIRHTPPSLKEAALSCRLARNAVSISVELLYPVSVAFTPPSELCVDFSGASEGGFGLFIIQNSVDQIIHSSPMPGIGSIMLIKHLPELTPTANIDTECMIAESAP